MLWLLGSTLLPFLLGAALAYFLDPLADRLERLGLSRTLATAVIAISSVLVFVLALVLLVPALIEQLSALVVAMPDYIARLMAFLGRRYPELFGEQSQIMRHLSGAETMLRDGGLTVLNQVLVGSLKLLDFLILLVVTPVVTFYLLLDWDGMVQEINQILPRQHAPTIRRLAREIDVVLAGFVRGQLSVCLILGAFYALALMAIGLQYGFLVGLIAGLVSFIPYVGSFVGLLLSVGIALFQFWDAKILGARDGGHLLLRPVRRREHPQPQPHRQVRRAASGLAHPRALGLRLPLRLRRPPRRRAGLGGARRPLALPRRALPREPLYTGRLPPEDGAP